MAKVVCGELSFSDKCSGQLSDLICILVSNDYIVEITPNKEKQEVVVTIMTKIGTGVIL